MRGAVGGLAMQGPINDPGFQPLRCPQPPPCPDGVPRDRRCVPSTKRSRQSLTVLTLQDWLRLTAAKVCPPAKPKNDPSSSRASSARPLWLRLMRFNSRRSGGLNRKGAGMEENHTTNTVRCHCYTALDSGTSRSLRIPETTQEAGSSRTGSRFDGGDEDVLPTVDSLEFWNGCSHGCT